MAELPGSLVAPSAARPGGFYSERPRALYRLFTSFDNPTMTR
jgi:hypothetical protein